MKKLLKNIICRSVNHARSTVHGRPSQQMRLGKKKKKKGKHRKKKHGCANVQSKHILNVSFF